jgi:hypothetical protein
VGKYKQDGNDQNLIQRNAWGKRGRTDRAKGTMRELGDHNLAKGRGTPEASVSFYDSTRRNIFVLAVVKARNFTMGEDIWNKLKLLYYNWGNISKFNVGYFTSVM